MRKFSKQIRLLLTILTIVFAVNISSGNIRGRRFQDGNGDTNALKDCTDVLQEKLDSSRQETPENPDAPDSLAVDSLIVSLSDSIAVDSLITDSIAVEDTAPKPVSYLLGGLSYDSLKACAAAADTDSVIVLTEKQIRKMIRDSIKAEKQYIKDSVRIEEDRVKDSIYTEKWKVKDSLKAIRNDKRYIRDSIKAARPRITVAYSIPDSMKFQRLLMWENDTYFNEPEFKEQDTTYNYHFSEYPFLKNDVDATYLGVIGSPSLYTNYFKREDVREFSYFSPYMMYSHTPENLPFFNTKSSYTELAYWGTLFANKEKEESNVKFLTTQNFTPELNLTISYQRFGSNGMLKREDTDNRTFAGYLNYMGKQYVMHVGYIYQGIKRSENGGVQNSSHITDPDAENADMGTDIRTVPVNLKDANSRLKRNSVFISHSFALPIRWGKGKNDTLVVTDSVNPSELIETEPERQQERPERKLPPSEGIGRPVADSAMTAMTDSTITAITDSTAASIADSTMADMQAPDKRPEIKEPIPDQMEVDFGTHEAIMSGTALYFGHHGEYTTYTRSYKDNISLSDQVGREFYDNRFFINPTRSADSSGLRMLENRIYVKIQPYGREAICSNISAGVGHQLLSYYGFRPEFFLEPSHRTNYNNLYLYAGVGGQYRKFFRWGGKVKYYFAGYNMHDFSIDANASMSLYPFPKGIHLDARFNLSNTRPDWFENNYYSNHYIWSNDFKKETTTSIEASLKIPRYKLSAFFGYELIDNLVYYGNDGMICQHETPMSVISAYIQKDFKIWKIHLDNQILFQYSSNQEVLPLPLLTLNLRWYFEFNLIRDVLKFQVGASAIMNTKYNMMAYNPATGAFQTQNEESLGLNPYIDIFANFQWKRACIFIKYGNASQKWFDSAYFSAYHYIRPQQTFKIGIFWPFYIH